MVHSSILKFNLSRVTSVSNSFFPFLPYFIPHPNFLHGVIFLKHTKNFNKPDSVSASLCLEFWFIYPHHHLYNLDLLVSVAELLQLIIIILGRIYQIHQNFTLKDSPCICCDPSGYEGSLLSSAPFAINMSCEFQILQASFLHYTSQKFQLIQYLLCYAWKEQIENDLIVMSPKGMWHIPSHNVYVLISLVCWTTTG